MARPRRILTFVIRNVSPKSISIHISKPNIPVENLLPDSSGFIKLNPTQAIEVERSRVNRQILDNLALARPKQIDVIPNSRTVDDIEPEEEPSETTQPGTEPSVGTDITDITDITDATGCPGDGTPENPACVSADDTGGICSSPQTVPVPPASSAEGAAFVWFEDTALSDVSFTATIDDAFGDIAIDYYGQDDTFTTREERVDLLGGDTEVFGFGGGGSLVNTGTDETPHYFLIVRLTGDNTEYCMQVSGT